MYHKKYKKNHRFFFFLIICVILFLFVPSKFVLSLKMFFTDFGDVIENFLIPKVQVDHTQLEFGINKELEEENNELRKMIQLKIKNYRFIYADVIKRNIQWYQEIVINKGKKDGISKDMVVVSNDCLIGKVIQTANHSSTVKLLTADTNDMKVAVDIFSKEEIYHGILDGYLENEKVLQVNHVAKNSDIEIGSFVYTNGLGGIYPGGIYIGKVKEIHSDSLGLSKVLKIETVTSYDKLRYVAVISKETENDNYIITRLFYRLLYCLFFTVFTTFFLIFTT